MWYHFSTVLSTCSFQAKKISQDTKMGQIAVLNAYIKYFPKHGLEKNCIVVKVEHQEILLDNINTCIR